MSASPDSVASQPLPYLPLPLVLGILQRLPANDIAASARLLSKQFHECFRAQTRILVSCRRELASSQRTGAPASASSGAVPPHAAAWWLRTHLIGEPARGRLTLRQRCALRDACASPPVAAVPPCTALWRAKLPAPPPPPNASAATNALTSTSKPTRDSTAVPMTPPSQPAPQTARPLLPPLNPIECYADVPTAILLGVAARQAPAYAAAACRELVLAAALHGDTDVLSQLAALEQVGLRERAAALAADLAYHAVRTKEVQQEETKDLNEGSAAAVGTAPSAAAVGAAKFRTGRTASGAPVEAATGKAHEAAPAAAVVGCSGFVRYEVLEWMAKADALWRSSDAPFLAAALSLRQRAAGGGGDSDGDDLEGPGAAEELRRALGRLHAAGFGSFHAAGRTFLAAVDLAARGKVAAELVCWLLDCGCPTGPPGWSYVAAVRPLIDGPASAAVSERCLGLAARLARRRVPLSAAALSGISGLPYDVFCSYVSLLVREYGCPLDRTALYGEVTASLRKASPNKHTPGPPPPQQQLPLQHLHAQQSGQPARMPLEDQQRKLAWLTDQRLAPTRLERWAPGRLLARTRERLRSLVGADGRGRGASAAAGGRSHSSQASGCVASAGGDARNWGAGAASAGVGGGVAFIETAAVAAAAGGKIGIGVAAREGGGPVPGPGASKSRGRAAAPSTLNRVEELLSGLPQNLGVGGGAVGLAASGRASATSELEEVFDTRASSVMAWDLQVA